ncbi:MAG: class I SAM-dependent methyltransferase [Dehalococcoidia bacterium]|nr:class I SAM-dependent methyltransferase [Dehalococcoidia bacterium]
MPEITSAKLSVDVRLLPTAGASVLDVGCGDGRHAAAAARRGCRAIGIDFDAAELLRARRRAGCLAVDFIVADAAHLPIRAGVIGAVICTETLEHLPDDQAAMREIARVMLPGALLLGAVPSHFTERLYFALSTGYREAPGGHLRIYTPRTLFSRLARAGLRVESMRYLHFFDSLFWLRYCLTDRLRPPARPRTDYERAIAVAVARLRATPSWRRRLRRAFGRSRLIAAVDAAGAAGAFVWPKSVAFVARKRRRHLSTSDGASAVSRAAGPPATSP